MQTDVLARPRSTEVRPRASKRTIRTGTYCEAEAVRSRVKRRACAEAPLMKYASTHAQPAVPANNAHAC
eukprot:3671199-Pleurochrysis_carterae.AAC.2